MGSKTGYYPNSRCKLDSFWTQLALDLHELLDIPLSKTRRPKVGYQIVRAIRQAMTQALRSGDYVTIQGFGTFRVVEKPPRLMRVRILSGIPFVLSREPSYSKAHKVVVFKPSVTLRAMVEGDNPTVAVRKHLRSVAAYNQRQLVKEPECISSIKQTQ